ncbi:MAG: PqqD family protein [Chlorobiales bacterium]|nr:PqqD family protein [Chlorobiales bacterium]
MNFDNSTLKELAISESGLIFDPVTGSIYTSNVVGLLILGALKDGKESGEIRNLIVGQYDVDEQTAERDVNDFMNQLNSIEVIKYV